MKLRNKKTGKVVDVESLGHAASLKEEDGYQVTLSWKTEYENLSQCKDYHSLAELNEEWEDYKPSEPLIKDEKVRNAVRAWADAMGLDAVNYEDGGFGVVFYSTDNMDDYKYQIEFSQYLDYLKSGYYRIDDLCGEEEQ